MSMDINEAKALLREWTDRYNEPHFDEYQVAALAAVLERLDSIEIWLADALARNQIVHEIDREKARSFLP